jgi:SET domain-containing protein
MKRYTSMDFKLKIGRSKTGKGLFTLDPIPKGCFIIEYTGKPVPKELQETKKGRYLFWTSKKDMIDGNTKTNTAKYINHSCKPNCEATGPNGHIYIISLRNIKSGEELTFNYGDEYFDEYIKNVGCRCNKCQSVTPLK